MLTMQPISIIADGKDAQGLNSYRVRFNCKGKEVEYTFLVDNDENPGVTADDEFVKATFCDPFAPALYQSILGFHKARAVEPTAEPKIAKVP